MHHDFELLKALALDPFSCHRALRAGHAAHVMASCNDPSTIANGAWSLAECCCDPGPDQFPEMEDSSLPPGRH
jgi:hypothetical protein